MKLLIKRRVFSWKDSYDVYQGCSAIIHIRKELFQWGDTYVIEYGNLEQELDGLLLVIAIDAANCTKWG